MTKDGHRIIAVDFDGTLSRAKWPAVGFPNDLLFEYLIECKERGDKIILFSCRTGDALRAAVMFCNERGLVFDTINENLPEVIEAYGEDPRKVTADVYIDDRGITADNVIPRWFELEYLINHTKERG